MNKPKPDFARQAAILAATAECMRVLAPMDTEERKRILFSLFLTTLEDTPKDNKVVEDLIEKMVGRMPR